VPEYEGRYPGLWSEDWVVDFLTKLRAQNPRFEKGVTGTMTLMAAGEFPMAVGMYLHRVLIMKEKGAPVEFAPLDKVIISGVSPYIIPKDAPHPNAARLFLRWMMGPEGAKLIEQVRHKGNPMPGSGTTASKYLEELGSTPVIGGMEIMDHFKRLQKKYLEAMGVPK
jgi:ABC-type Fe3+ transport system substrate-binding protein